MHRFVQPILSTPIWMLICGIAAAMAIMCLHAASREMERSLRRQQLINQYRRLQAQREGQESAAVIASAAPATKLTGAAAPSKAAA